MPRPRTSRRRLGHGQIPFRAPITFSSENDGVVSTFTFSRPVRVKQWPTLVTLPVLVSFVQTAPNVVVATYDQDITGQTLNWPANTPGVRGQDGTPIAPTTYVA